jgi:nitrite reductase/ring-hydroxylating ferredoxin subunit
MDIRIGKTGAMQVGDCRTFEFPRNGRPAQGFIIRYRDGFHAYLNQCCHWLVPLDLGDGDFYYAAIDRITCKTHGATYEPATGFCDSGPCFRANLEAYPAAAAGDEVIVTVPG